ncbi:MAG: efflux RND transporter periplasmic adaptor subunit [Pseudomonadota bacterium]|nr:efflux RND transporter periplasmic adaptor subunit [Pseudomonadota bacterium]
MVFMLAVLRQIIVTALVVILGVGALVAVKPEAGRALLSSDLPLPGVARDAIVWIAPEAGEPAKDLAQGPGPGRRGSGKIAAVVSPVVLEESQSDMRALASAEAVRSVVVHPDSTSGLIEEVLVSSGDVVEAGAPLVRLEQASESVAVDRARLALAATEDKLTRYEQLVRRNAVTNVEVTDVTRERDAALLDLRAAEIALRKREVKAPIAGRVGIVTVEKGTMVDASTTIATIDDRSELKLVFYMPERFLSDISIGTPVRATSIARPDAVNEGKIVAIDSRVDEESRTVRTEARIDNEDDRLRPGMSFAVTVALEGKDYLATDPLAVVWERTGPFVWKVAGGKAEKAPVRIVQRDVDRVLVVSDALQPDDLVVVEGIQPMRPGADIEIESTAPPAAPSEPSGPLAARDVEGDSAEAKPTDAARSSTSLPVIGEAAAGERAAQPSPANRSGS